MFFKKKDKKQNTPHPVYKKMCPDCHKTNLRQTQFSTIVSGQPKFNCPDCGYVGYVYIDSSPSDSFEEELIEELLEDNPDWVETRKSASELARKSLEVKWIPNQSENSKTLHEWCPFCEDVEVICQICKCPPEICADHAESGLIGILNEKYDQDTLLSDVDPEIYAKIVKGFKKLIK